MGTLIDLTGQKFGRLIVIERYHSEPSWTRPMWLCRCKCGVIKSIYGQDLRSGHTRSCGCLSRERKIGGINKLSFGFANMRKRIRDYKDHAEMRGISFEITEKQFKELTQRDCHYCGAKPNNIAKVKGLFGEYIYNGLDRIDNNKGYTINNVVPCCKRCNSAKKNLTLQDFQDWIERIYDNMHKDIN